jgi:hypothetical protein
MNSQMRRQQAAKLLEATVAWWEQTANVTGDDEGSDRGISGATVLDQYCYQNRVSFGDVTYLIARGTLAVTDGEYRKAGVPVQHLKDAVAYLFDAQRS